VRESGETHFIISGVRLQQKKLLNKIPHLKANNNGNKESGIGIIIIKELSVGVCMRRNEKRPPTNFICVSFEVAMETQHDSAPRIIQNY
jgi:hypothetical protein